MRAPYKDSSTECAGHSGGSPKSLLRYERRPLQRESWSCLQHGISAEEPATWTTAYQAHGLDGLRVIKREAPIDLQIAERDEWRAAKLLIRRHGDQAQDEATRLANLVFFGDTWQSRWVRIGRAIEALQAPKRSERN